MHNPMNPVDQPILDLLQNRWSPYCFDPSRDVSSADLHAMLEAARWAQSAYNEQPWRYVVAVKSKDAALFDKVLGCLVEANQGWAQHAPVLMLGLYKPRFQHNDKPNGTAIHDLGAASTYLTVEAQSRGISVHQMSGIDHDKTRQAFALGDDLQPLTALAVGYAGENSELDSGIAQRDQRPRERRPVSELVVFSSL